MKKVVFIVLAVVLVFGLVACSSAPAPSASSAAPASSAAASVAPASSAAAPASSAAAAPAGKIGMSLSTLNNAFFVGMRIGILNEAKKVGVTIVEENANGDMTTQTSQMEDLISQGVAAIISNPIDSDAIVPSEAKALAAKIPVIYCDRGSSSGNYTSFIATDNVAMGALAADKIAEYLTKKNGSAKGNVVEIQGLMGTSAAKDRGQGFNDQLKKYPDIKVVASQAGDFDQEKSLNVMTNILQAQPSIDAVYGHNDDCTLGAAKAIEAAGKMKPAGQDGHIYIIGIDGIMDALTAIKDGKIDETIAQDPVGMGANAVDLAVKIMGGGTVDKNIKQPFKEVTAANAMDASNWAVAAAAAK